MIPLRLVSCGWGSGGWLVDRHEFRSEQAAHLYGWALSEAQAGSRRKAVTLARVAERLELRRSGRRVRLI